MPQNNEFLEECLAKRATAAWELTPELFRPAILAAAVAVIRRFGAPDFSLVEDLLQEVYLKLCENDYRILRESRATAVRGLYALVQSVATTTALNYFRSKNTEKRGGGSIVVSIDDLNSREPTSNEAANVERAMLIGEIDMRVRRICTGENGARDRSIFWFHHRLGLTSQEISRIPSIGLSQKGVETVLRRITMDLREDLGELTVCAK